MAGAAQRWQLLGEPSQRAHCRFALEKAVLQRNQRVTARGIGTDLAMDDGKFSLVARAVGLSAAQRLPDDGLRQAADARQCVVHAPALELQRLGIFHVPRVAAAAAPIVGAVRLPARAGGLQHARHAPFAEARSLADDFHLHAFAGQRARHEHRTAVVGPAHALKLRTGSGDANLLQGHWRMTAITSTRSTRPASAACSPF